METIDLLSIVTIALLGSFGHCVGMCGGIVIAYSSSKVDIGWGRIKQALSHLLYSAGRITTYVILGVVFGYLGSVTTFSNSANGTLLVIAGVAMVLTGLSLLGKIKFLTVVEHTISTSSWYRKSFKSLIGRQSLPSFFILGMLNGLLPCGFVYFFAIAAASTASALWGGVVMAVFGLSTIPALFSLGFFVGIFQQSNLRNLMVRLASIAVIVYGGYTLYHGYHFFTASEQKTAAEIRR
ncbi:MAG: sulfite exporter TauE/SafE family protein [Sulfurimonadaceae bacterium]|nr:sulfite exporter TauE/SafE family protein [Sulfurimonadaceae bacterium]